MYLTRHSHSDNPTRTEHCAAWSYRGYALSASGWLDWSDIKRLEQNAQGRRPLSLVAHCMQCSNDTLTRYGVSSASLVEEQAT